jgi:hypothetical protein
MPYEKVICMRKKYKQRITKVDEANCDYTQETSDNLMFQLLWRLIGAIITIVLAIVLTMSSREVDIDFTLLFL